MKYIWEDEIFILSIAYQKESSILSLNKMNILVNLNFIFREINIQSSRYNNFIV